MAQTSTAQITYRPRADASTDGEKYALAAIYSLAIQKYQENAKGTRPGAPEDPQRSSNGWATQHHNK